MKRFYFAVRLDGYGRIDKYEDAEDRPSALAMLQATLKAEFPGRSFSITNPSEASNHAVSKIA